MSNITLAGTAQRARNVRNLKVKKEKKIGHKKTIGLRLLSGDLITHADQW